MGCPFLSTVSLLQKHNFQKNTWNLTALNQNTQYDYASIMHYGTTFFTNNGKPTMVPRQTGAVIGEAKELSRTDIWEVRNLYGC
jgi:hypothetical protein